jgi:hypothetical protein
MDVSSVGVGWLQSLAKRRANKTERRTAPPPLVCVCVTCTFELACLLLEINGLLTFIQRTFTTPSKADYGAGPAWGCHSHSCVGTFGIVTTVDSRAASGCCCFS